MLMPSWRSTNRMARYRDPTVSEVLLIGLRCGMFESDLEAAERWLRRMGLHPPASRCELGNRIVYAQQLRRKG